MKRFILFSILLSCILNYAFGEEFTVSYNEGTDQSYCITYRTLEDAPGTVEVSYTEFFDRELFKWNIVDVVEIPEIIEVDGKCYTVTTINTETDWGGDDRGPKKVIFPSTIRWIKSSIWSPILEEIIIDDAPIEEVYLIHNNQNLRYVDFGNACVITKLPWGCFQNCPSLSLIKLPESIKIIEPQAFEGCVSLHSISLPSSLESIERAFIGCTSLEDVDYKGNNLIDLGCETFKNCESLMSIALPSVSHIGSDAFLNCTNLSTVILNESSNSDIKIDSHAFDNCIKLKEVKFDVESLKEIGEAAFNNCSSLQSFSIPTDCENIGSKAFAGCTGLEKFNVIDEGGYYSDIDGVLIRDRYQIAAYPAGKKEEKYSIPESVTSISNGAFEGAVHLEDLDIHDNVNNIGVMAFRDCKALKQVNLPSNLNHLPSGIFSGCSSLESVIIPDNYIYIGASSFQGCSALPEVKLPSELKVLGESAFINCSKIESIELPDQMTEIRSNTFRNCESLKTIKLSARLDTIHTAALQGCKSLQSIELSESLKCLEERSFKGCESIDNLVIPDKVTQIGINAFEDCSSLKEVVVGNGVKEIGQWAFFNCTDMEKLVLGSSLEKIGAEAFDGDINIRDITCLSPDPPTFPGGFPDEVTANATVTVPEGSEDAYNASPEWDEMVEGELPKAETIELNLDEVRLLLKETVILTATVYPEDAIDKTIVWTSKDYEVAKVDENGLVTAKGFGATEIVATCGNASASCKVTVVDEVEGVESIFTDPEMEADVYDINGVLIHSKIKAEDIKVLPAGIYILKNADLTTKVIIR